ncbi:hypothetical protein H5410_005618 [Solanum commersonii]|uniref:Uncharacterized protein n=1 Tax=Solanum commersonii TaxID=4109 RepID=A0A9J6A7M8_SOLCO|nr:hypothetical protein H5410_005618 [Solanum commersonii]
MALFNHMTLVALPAQPASVRPRKSLLVNAKLNGKYVRIMVDIGATHNFVMKERAKDLCLNYVASDTMLKIVNGLPTAVHGFAPKREKYSFAQPTVQFLGHTINHGEMK